MSQIQSALNQLFRKHRIVFWYDVKRELRPEFESLMLPGVEAIELSNNEFQVKHRILREQPEQKFLLYFEGPPPEDIHNWLLDVQLAYGQFHADQAGLWLSELGLGVEFLEVVHAYPEFFNAQRRRDILKNMLIPDDTPDVLRMKMLAVCAGCEPRLDEILEALLAELAEDTNEKFATITRCNLESVLWARLERDFAYRSESSSPLDFGIALFKSCYELLLGQPGRLGLEALVFMKRWKDSLSQHQAFEKLSERYAEILNIKQDLLDRHYMDVVDIDLFLLIDQKILSGLADAIADRTISADQCHVITRKRRSTHWYSRFEHVYETLDHAADFLHLMEAIVLRVDSIKDGLMSYLNSWYQIDQIYRKVIYHARKSGQVSLLEAVVNQVEKKYNNQYLLRLNNNWQQVVDACHRWSDFGLTPQKEFFDHWVRSSLQKEKKIYVIISDAFRYEIAEEFLHLIRSEDRYEAELEAMIASLPSYTQLGMAALLPNQEISLVSDASGNVLVDGLPAVGTVNRDKILKEATNQKAKAVLAEEVLSMNKETCRELVRDHDVVYIYHNRIDATGDKRDTEERVFEAVEQTLEELLTIVKKMTAANATNLIITADHGFIYQNQPLDESEFSDAEVKGQQILYLHRRFVIGTGLVEHSGLKKFMAPELNLRGNIEVQIPKSINRLRIRGSGSRYVHGGAALQEIILPVLKINKKRESDIKTVTVEILRGTVNLITSGQFTVSFYQTEPVSEKVHPRTLRAGIYTLEGELISDSHELLFDLTHENARQREIQVRFVLGRAADKANNQEVILRLEEQVPGTTHYKEHKSARYTIRRSFTSDFDL